MKRIIGGIIIVVIALAAIGSFAGKPDAGSPASPTPVAPITALAPTATQTQAVSEDTPEPEPTAEPTPKPTTAPPITYAKLGPRAWQQIVKTPDKYIGRGYQVWACITQFDAATGEEAFLAIASYKRQTYWYTNGDNAWFTGPAYRLEDFVEDDVVLMNVVGTGAYSYDTQAGGNTTVPSFRVSTIRRMGSCA